MALVCLLWALVGKSTENCIPNAEINISLSFSLSLHCFRSKQKHIPPYSKTRPVFGTAAI